MLTMIDLYIYKRNADNDWYDTFIQRNAHNDWSVHL